MNSLYFQILSGTEIANILEINPGPIIGTAIAWLLDQQDTWASRGKELTKDDASKLLITRFKNRSSNVH